MKTLSLKNKILFGIYLLYCIKKLKSPLVTQALTLLVLGGILSYFVSVPSVVANMLDSQSFYRYFIISLSNTEILVQAILALVGITSIVFLRNITIHTIFKPRFA